MYSHRDLLVGSSVHTTRLILCLLLASFIGMSASTQQGHIQLDEPLKNMSRYAGDTIRIRCEITGDPMPRYSWYKNNVPIRELPQEEASRINARATPWGSRLKISTLTFTDAGTYMCTGTNNFGETSVTGALTVLPKPRSTKKGRNQDRASEEDMEPDSIHIGDLYPPEPRFKPVDPVRTYGRRHDTTGVINEEIEHIDEGFCQPYRGYACSKHISNSNIFVKNKLQQSQVEERVTIAVTVIASSTELSQRCGQFIIPSLCRFSFPLCDDVSATPTARMMCRDECEMLENVYCKTEYLLARSGHFGNGQLVLPNCEDLPLPGTAAAQNCLSIGLRQTSLGNQLQSAETQQRCYNATGQSYRGTASTTKSGYTCQTWTSDTPHQHYFSPSQYPELADNNYCRNPGNTEEAPWCFTMNKIVVKEACNLPRCVPYASKRPERSRRMMDGMLMTLIPAIAIPVAIILLVIVICVCRRRRNKHQRNEKPNTTQAQPLEMSAMLAKTPEHACEFPMSSIRFTREIGEGTSGKVYRAQLVGYFRGNSATDVIIRTLKSNAPPKVQNDFRREIEIKTSLKHMNVLGLLGVCVKEEPICMVFEYMLHGDLHDYLVVHSPHSDVPMANGHRHILDHNDMMHFAVQVACGMEYLAGRNYVHRDIAARNVLVGNNLSVKISDFGNTQPGYSADYYRGNNDALLPVRWMPPEAIVYGKFGVESDVWSFGVMMWELYSYGTQPYFGYSNLEVMQMVRVHQVLPCPAECPAQVYALMVDCWNETPQRRPRFTKVLGQLRVWKAEIQTHTQQQYGVAHNDTQQQYGVAHNDTNQQYGVGHNDTQQQYGVGHNDTNQQYSGAHNHNNSSGQTSQQSSSAQSNNTGVTGVTNNYTQDQQPPSYYNHQHPPQPYHNQPQGVYGLPSPPASHKSSSAGSGSNHNDFRDKVNRNNIANCGNGGNKCGSLLNSPMSDAAADGYIPGLRTSNL